MAWRCLLTVMVLFFAPQALAQSPPAAVAPPDVLLICIDDLNDWIGCMGGHPQVQTPNIDRLAARGVLFTNAHCQAPVCLASRASFMSGRLPSSTGVYGLGPNLHETPELAEALMLPQWFAAQGYTTMGTGKIYHGGSGQEYFQSYGPRGGAGPLPPEDQRINYFQDTRLWDWGAFPERDDQMPDHQVATWAVEQLSAQRQGPLFLAVGFNRPHVPLYAPQHWFDALPPVEEIVLPETLDTDRADIPDYGQRLTAGFPAPRHQWMLDNNQWQNCVRSYLACIMFVDAQVGRVLDALDASGQADNTIVILLSDHGFHMGEKQRWAKRSLWEESTRVPLIIAGPGIEPGRTCTQPAGLIDIYPTLAELRGVAGPGNLEGESLAPQLADVQAPHRPVLTTWWTGNHTIRSERYRYIRYADGSEEFYDHESDPNEWQNLVSNVEYARLIAEHRAALPSVDYPALPSNAALGCSPQDREFFKVRN